MTPEERERAFERHLVEHQRRVDQRVRDEDRFRRIVGNPWTDLVVAAACFALVLTTAHDLTPRWLAEVCLLVLIGRGVAALIASNLRR